jgi:tetratricopeptide (TPR) repeat protein
MTMNRTLTITLGLATLAIAFGACATSDRGAYVRLPAMDRGIALYNNGEYVSAADAFTDAITERPRYAAAWSNRAAARVRMGDVNGAIADYNKAIELAPLDPELYFNRGNALVAAGQHDTAIADYNRALELNPAYARAQFNRGTALALTGQRERAGADWARAIEIEPDPWAKASMRRSAGVQVPVPVVASRAPTDLPPNILAPAPPAGTGPATVPMPSVPSPVVVAPSAPQPAAAPAALDARALASRAISRELDGDHAGAMQDLNAALSIEPDPSRRAHLTNLIRLLDTPK